jgi:hypothetical protein
LLNTGPSTKPSVDADGPPVDTPAPDPAPAPRRWSLRELFRPGVPEDFVGFVAAEKDALRQQSIMLTGHEEYADTIRRDLLAAVALRWRWWGLRAAPARDQAARVMVARGLRREQRSWPPERGLPGQGETLRGRRSRLSGTSDTESGRMRVMPTDPAPVRPDRSAADLAAIAWSRARQVRRTRTAAATAVLVCLAILAILSPRLVRQIPPPEVGPTAVPAGVLLMPAYDQLPTLAVRGVALTANLDIGSDEVPLTPTTLRDKPPAKVMALLQHAGGSIYAFAPDGTVRVIDNHELTTPAAQLYPTSLSPDGLRAVFASANGIYVLDVTTGKVREIDSGGPPAQLTWRSNRIIIVPNFATALQIDVDTGSIGALATTNGTDVIAQQGQKPTAPMLELIPASSSPRLRVWRTEPVVTTDPVKSTPAVTDVEDRPIFGPPWVGRWTGPGFAEGDLIVRACGPETIRLPAKNGTAHSAVGALVTNGLYAATLVGTDATTLDVLGMADPQTVLVNATGPKSSTLLAWAPQPGLLQRVSTISRTVVISVVDTSTVLAN